MKLDEYNIEVFKSIRVEINERVKIHYLMVMWKIALGGGFVGFMIEKGSSIPIPPLFLGAIFLFLMDIVIVENLGHIRSSGLFIKQNIENYNNQDEIIKWESDFAQADNSWGCFSAKGYIFGIWIIAPFMALGGFYMNFNPIDKLHITTLAVIIYYAGYSLYLINKELGNQRFINIKQSKSPIKS